MTALLSVTHRGTGIALSGMMIGAGLGSLLLPMPFPEALALVQVKPQLLIPHLKKLSRISCLQFLISFVVFSVGRCVFQAQTHFLLRGLSYSRRISLILVNTQKLVCLRRFFELFLLLRSYKIILTIIDTLLNILA
jgi:hypothetical protein